MSPSFTAIVKQDNVIRIFLHVCVCVCGLTVHFLTSLHKRMTSVIIIAAHKKRWRRLWAQNDRHIVVADNVIVMVTIAGCHTLLSLPFTVFLYWPLNNSKNKAELRCVWLVRMQSKSPVHQTE